MDSKGNSINMALAEENLSHPRPILTLVSSNSSSSDDGRGNANGHSIGSRESSIGTTNAVVENSQSQEGGWEVIGDLNGGGGDSDSAGNIGQSLVDDTLTESFVMVEYISFYDIGDYVWIEISDSGSAENIDIIGQSLVDDTSTESFVMVEYISVYDIGDYVWIKINEETLVYN